jgi:cell division protein FtsW (lipid II flippase)
VLLGLVSLAKSLAFGTNRDRIVAGLTIVIAVVAVLLVAASDFGHTQVVLDVPLDSMNFWSQLVVAVILAGLGSGVWQGLAAVKNVGQNQVAAAQPPAEKKAA